MLATLATGLTALCGVLVAWVSVQLAWRRAFPDAGTDPDALAGRLTCHGSCQPNECTRRCPAHGAGPTQEDDR